MIFIPDSTFSFSFLSLFAGKTYLTVPFYLSCLKNLFEVTSQFREPRKMFTKETYEKFWPEIVSLYFPAGSLNCDDYL